MLKKLTILFLLSSVVFCFMLHYLLFYADHHGNKFLLAALVFGLVLNCVFLARTINRFLNFTMRKDQKH